MIGFVIALVVTLVSIGGFFGVIFWFRSKASKMVFTKFDRSNELGIENTQDILPFEKIKNNRIFLGKQRYVAYLKVEPVNYIIRSEDGKDSFAIQLRRAFNNFDFRYRIFTHTRKMVNDKMLTELQRNIEQTLLAHPDQREYAEEYFKYLSIINIRDQNTGDIRTVKDFYIVIPWEPSIDEAGQTEEEIEYQAKLELERRVVQVQESFRQAGITTNILATVDIINLFTSIYRREESNRADMLFLDSYTSVLVAGDEESKKAKEFIRFASIIEGARNQLGEEILNNPYISQETKDNALQVIEVFSNIERKIKGH